MDAFKRNFLRHALAVQRWMRRHGARGGIDAVTLALDLEHGGRSAHLWPQFFAREPGGAGRFERELGEATQGFVSWLPYERKVWPIAQDKLAFKEWALAHELRTPAFAWEASGMQRSFLVKARRSSFGALQRGPFAAGTQLTLAPGEYCEQFVFGCLVKAWFWEEALLVVEVVPMPLVQGDGAHTLAELVSAQLGPGTRPPSYLADLAAVQGLALDTVLTNGQSAVADYQYMSPLNPSISIDHDVRARIAGTPLEAQLLAAGRSCAAAIPSELRRHTAFTLDGVVDGAGALWLLEANCNPLLHPSFYAGMLDELFFGAP